MTTKIRIVSVPDLFTDNELINLGRMHLPEGNSLAGACWCVEGLSAYEALLFVLRVLYRLIGKTFPSYKVWLFIGNSTWQPDTRIVRFRKLWGALAARGIDIPHASGTQELMCELKGKLKFFGATQLSEFSVGSVAKALVEERCAYVVALPSCIGPEEILDIGWSGELAEDSKVIASLIEKDGLLIKRFGEFDDVEKGVLGVGRPELVKLLLT